MRFPTLPDGSIDEVRAEKLLNTAREAGVNYFDTAFPYHGGASEPFVGRVIAKWPRESFYLATKLPLWSCKTLDEAKAIFEQQFQRLGVDYIDFYLLHSLHKARYDAAKEMGYHNAISNASDIYSANSFQPPMTIGTVQASPLTMANVYATMGANGVECTPIAITKVTDRSGSKVKVPSANCHQAIDPDIAQTVSYALNQGVVQPGGEASTTQLDNNRKTFAKTGTNENTVMTTAGFVPNQVAAFVAVADAQDPINNTFDNKTINGVYRPSWYGMYIATPAWKQFMNTYLAAINAPIDNDYGKGADKYTVSKGATRTYNQYQYQRQQNSQQQSQQQRRKPFRLYHCHEKIPLSSFSLHPCRKSAKHGTNGIVSHFRPD